MAALKMFSISTDGSVDRWSANLRGHHVVFEVQGDEVRVTEGSIDVAGEVVRSVELLAEEATFAIRRA